MIIMVDGIYWVWFGFGIVRMCVCVDRISVVEKKMDR